MSDHLQFLNESERYSYILMSCVAKPILLIFFCFGFGVTKLSQNIKTLFLLPESDSGIYVIHLEGEKGKEEGQTEDRGEWDRVESTDTDGDETCGLIWEEEVWDPSRYAGVWAPNLCPACQEPLFAVCECVGQRRGREMSEVEMQGRGGRQDELPQEESRQQEGWQQGRQCNQERQDTGREQASLEEFIKNMKRQMLEEERQKQVSGEEEARRESERGWERRQAWKGEETEGQGLRDEDREGTRWEIGKGKGTRRGKLGLERRRMAGGLARHEGKGRAILTNREHGKSGG